MAYFGAQGAVVPAKGPVIKIKTLSGERGSTPGFASSYRYLAPNPLPPMNSLAHSAFRSSEETFPLLRSTRNIFPTYPPTILFTYSTISSVSSGHISTHRGFPLHISHFIAYFSTGSRLSPLYEQTSTQAPQPVHSSLSTT